MRDREVLLDRLESEIKGLDARDQRVGESLTVNLRAELEESRAELRSAFDSERYLDLVELLIEAARRPRLTPDAAAPAAGCSPR